MKRAINIEFDDSIVHRCLGAMQFNSKVLFCALRTSDVEMNEKTTQLLPTAVDKRPANSD